MKQATRRAVGTSGLLWYVRTKNGNCTMRSYFCAQQVQYDFKPTTQACTLLVGPHKFIVVQYRPFWAKKPEFPEQSLKKP
jgi:hypothetical protein